MTPIYLAIQTRRPRDGDAGAAAEAWYYQDNDHVQMCDRDGEPLAGAKNRKKLRPGGTAREGAVQLLKADASRFGSRQSFNRPLRYPTVRF
jgi:hypothetical protein